MRPKPPAATAASVPATCRKRWRPEIEQRWLAMLRPKNARHRGRDCVEDPRKLLAEVAQHFGAQTVAQIGALQAESDIGAQEARLRAAIVALALEFHAVERLAFRKPDHAVGQLDLAAGAALL